jgi:hypothetical protein
MSFHFVKKKFPIRFAHKKLFISFELIADSGNVVECSRARERERVILCVEREKGKKRRKS